MNTHAQISPNRLIRSVALLLILSTPMMSMNGCSVWENRPRLRTQEIDMNVSTDGIPPIMVNTLADKHMLIMQAPHSGWAIDIDKDERIADGMRLFVTVRRPDPSFMYPQAIVEKQLLTAIHAQTTMETYVRVLDAHEKADGHGYGLLVPVEHFEN